MMRSIALIIYSAALLVGTCLPQTGSQAIGSIRGEVVTTAKNGEPSVVPNARIVLRGLADREAQSDERGATVIDGLSPWVYRVESSAPGLSESLTVGVKSGIAFVMAMELNVVSVTSAVTVTASDPAIKQSAQKTTIGQAVAEHAPNRDEKIDSLLPLVLGVVRGPDGRINVKDAGATQAGWVVNSADVTDPATDVGCNGVLLRRFSAKKRPTLNPSIASATVFERFGCFASDWSWMC